MLYFSQLFLSYFSYVFPLSLWCIKIYVCVFVWYTVYIVYIYRYLCYVSAYVRQYLENINSNQNWREARREWESPRKSHNQYIKAFINLQNKVLSSMRPYALKTQQRRMLSNTLDIGTFYARARSLPLISSPVFGCCQGVRCNVFVRCIRVLRESFVIQNIKFYAELMLLLLSKLYSENPSSNSNNISRIHPPPPFIFGFGANTYNNDRDCRRIANLVNLIVVASLFAFVFHRLHLIRRQRVHQLHNEKKKNPIYLYLIRSSILIKWKSWETKIVVHETNECKPFHTQPHHHRK